MSRSLIHHHDAFFKQFMGRPELAATFLREHLPPQIARLLAPELPVQIPGSYVDEELAQHHSDLVFKVRLLSGNTAIAYILLEHKSSPDPATRLQLLRYIVRILTKWHAEHEILPLPVVVPLVAHQGPQGWTYSTEFTDLFGDVPEALRPLNQRRREKVMGHFSAQFEAQGVSKSLVRLLEIRFGGIPRSVRERILASDAATVQAWFDRAVEARELQAVFEPKVAA